jgi:hypothetical protein
MVSVVRNGPISVNQNLVVKTRSILYLAFFGLGFNQSFLYLPAFALYVFFQGAQLSSLRLSRRYLVLATLLSLATFPLYLLGHEQITLEYPLRAMLLLLFTIIVAGYALQLQEKRAQYILIILYAAGMGFEALIITGVSYVSDPEFYGYGRLLDPFSGRQINSPSVSNNLAVFAVLLFYVMLNASGFIIKLLASVFLASTIISAFFLGGRTFFIIVSLGAFILVVLCLDKKKLVPLLVGVCLVAVFVYIAAGLFEEFERYIIFSLERLVLGFESTRYSHYAHGLGEFIYYPFGGFGVDQAVENTSWFHNVFLDNARLAGWFPVLSLIAAMGYILTAIRYYEDPFFDFGVTFFFIAFLILQVDVVIEGNVRILMLMYFVGLLLLNRRSGTVFR